MPITYTLVISPPTDLSHHFSAQQIIGRTLSDHGIVVALVLDDAVYRDHTYHTIVPLSDEYDLLQHITLVSTGDTWRGFPLTLSPNNHVAISNHPNTINFSSTLTRQILNITLDPSGFFVLIGINGIDSLYRLYCTESDYAQGITANGTDTIVIRYDQSHRLATSTDGKDTHWAFVPLFNTTLEWTIDLSTIPCGLNATFYSAKQRVGSQYADACATNPSEAEFDFMEANREAWHTTLHCKTNDCGNAPPIGFGGTISDPRYLFKNTRDGSIENTYGPGTGFTINTLLPFRAKITQTVLNDQLVAVQLTLTQNSQTVSATLDASNEEYPGKLQKFGQEINDTSSTYGNVFFWSLWTGGLDWLESPPCPPGSSAPTDPSDRYIISSITVANT